MTSEPAIDRLAQALEPFGFEVFGTVALTDEDRTLAGLGPSAQAAVLIGNAGPAMWRAFDAARSDDPALAANPDPMDTWTRSVVRRIVAGLGLGATTQQVVFPFEGPPYSPFQRWAVRTGRFFASPIGPLVHRTYGPWAGFRAAVILDAALAGPVESVSDGAQDASPCEACADKPCLTACPVGAFKGDGYDVPACVEHISTPDGGDCVGFGCLARRACPYGHAYHQAPEQAAFHMGRFLAARRAATS